MSKRNGLSRVYLNYKTYLIIGIKTYPRILIMMIARTTGINTTIVHLCSTINCTNSLTILIMSMYINPHLNPKNIPIPMAIIENIIPGIHRIRFRELSPDQNSPYPFQNADPPAKRITE